ncbi:alcohol dehydrogenase [Pueribacillus theae]|uniref:Alcohol dehydrogenase n=1 Tax=Pueribacillus theae TaxID=2171751 RepID=A0A2U1JVL8_9BACI|nr:zinc-binding dehydrogenase [Pueribacillus theae]PWA09025.1 alcohol dehydrogenase [Pueribacillus theae]
MKAVVHKGKQGLDGVQVIEMEEGSPSSNEVKVRLKAAGLNHRDLFVPFRHGENEPAVVLGSDGAGVIEEIGENVKNVAVGDEVIIIPSLGWKEKSDAPPKGFEILGLPDHGTFAETIVIPAENAVKKPENLSWEEAGVLPLAALTGYRALFTRGNLQEGQHLLLPGIGSGVATYILQMAKAAGAKVTVTSRSEKKRKLALELGADAAIDSDGDWSKQMNGEKADIVIDSVGAATFTKSLAQLRLGGTIVVFGASAGDEITLDLRKFFYGQYNFLGTTMGSNEEFYEMLTFFKKHNIKPIVDKVFPLNEALDALRYLEEAEQFGKVALRIGQ